MNSERDSDSYVAWLKLYPKTVENEWEKESTELRNVSMLLCALKQEFRDIETNLTTKVSRIRRNLKLNNLQQKENQHISPNACDLQSSKDLDTSITLKNKSRSFDSPDLFRNLDKTLNSSNSDEFISDEERPKTTACITSTSPIILKKSREYYNKSKIVASSPSRYLLSLNKDKHSKQGKMSPKQVFKTPQNLCNEDICENSIIECTPENKNKFKRVRKSRKTNCSSKSSITLTQMYPKETDSTIKDSSISSSRCQPESIRVVSDDSEMGITQLIEYIHKNNPVNEPQTNSLRDDDETQVNMDIDETQGAPLGIKEPRVEGEAVVRGYARKKLPGWSCNDCKKFYECQNLSEKEMLKKINECSRHRSRFKPQEDTLPGFWDLTLVP